MYGSYLILIFKHLVLISSAGFPPNTFWYYRFSLEIEFKIHLGSGGSCNLWLKQHSNLKALLFICDKWYSYYITTSNIQDFPILWFHIHTPTIFLLANLLFLNMKWFQWEKISILVSINNCMQGMHVIFNSININERQIWEIEQNKSKKIELVFEIGF